MQKIIMTKNRIYKLLKPILKLFGVCFGTVFVLWGLMYLSEIEANANQSSNYVTAEQLSEAAKRTAGVAEDIMTADDFLFENERAADVEAISEYIEELRTKGIIVKETEEPRFPLNNEELEVKEDDSLETNDVDDNLEEDEINLDSLDSDELDVIPGDGEEGVACDSKEDIDANDWRLILVNKQNPVPEDYETNLSNINGSLKADSRIIDDIYKMLDAAKKDGVDLMICSAYRSYDRQITLFNNKMNKLMGQGMSYMEAYAVGSMSVTVPGTSEHQIGLALDILTSSYTSMDDGFGQTAAGKWLYENADDYGFILRYPKGKEEITGIIYEPWHFRYVGTDYSKKITELGVTLEEFVNGDY